MSEIKYICPVEYYPNCRGHEVGYYSGVEFFKNIEDLLFFIIKRLDEYAILGIYSSDGIFVGTVEYQISTHNCTGAILNIEEEKYRTIDDGKGNLTWRKDG